MCTQRTHLRERLKASINQRFPTYLRPFVTNRTPSKYTYADARIVRRWLREQLAADEKNNVINNNELRNETSIVDLRGATKQDNVEVEVWPYAIVSALPVFGMLPIEFISIFLLNLQCRYMIHYLYSTLFATPMR